MLGEYIRERRTQQGIGLRKLAMSCEISATYLSRIENGHEHKVSDRVLLALASELDIEPYQVFEEAGRVPWFVQEYLLKKGLQSLMEEAQSAKQ